ncbi:MAG: hypothetical protein SCABRO_02297 [Candidatus Scalindua brodae]|uniref:Uncharacterized protein n=1 Tax=Candidatus Scalindua brodae TaxID=237368 RepID=A0A0B0EIX2_9BACT|nr:MAG: hypothetical protein SCABRO_02297 [Candidatus Scalindua brodae]
MKGDRIFFLLFFLICFTSMKTWRIQLPIFRVFMLNIRIGGKFSENSGSAYEIQKGYLDEIKSVEPTHPSFANRLFLGSLLILFLSIILFAIRGCSPQRYVFLP